MKLAVFLFTSNNSVILDIFPGMLDKALKISAELSSVFSNGSENVKNMKWVKALLT